jgi:hypothetical protein
MKLKKIPQKGGTMNKSLSKILNGGYSPVRNLIKKQAPEGACLFGRGPGEIQIPGSVFFLINPEFRVL